MSVDKKALDAVSYHIREENTWELENTQEIMSKLQWLKQEFPGKQITLIDVGANIGWFSLVAASKGFHVLAFEPMKENIKIMRANINQNSFEKYINLVEVALGNKEDQDCLISSPSDNILNGNLYCESTTKVMIPNDQGRERQQLHLKKLDSFTETAASEKTFFGVMKIDTEGFEMYVLKGAKNFLLTHRVPFILLEYFERKMLAQGYNGPQLLRLLKQYGYEVRVNSFDGPVVNSVKEIYENVKSKEQFTNLYCIRIE
eukprot:403348513